MRGNEFLFSQVQDERTIKLSQIGKLEFSALERCPKSSVCSGSTSLGGSVEMKNEESDNGQNLTQEEKSEIIQSWFDKYKIKTIVVKRYDKIFYLDE